MSVSPVRAPVIHIHMYTWLDTCETWRLLLHWLLAISSGHCDVDCLHHKCRSLESPELEAVNSVQPTVSEAMQITG